MYTSMCPLPPSMSTRTRIGNPLANVMLTTLPRWAIFEILPNCDMGTRYCRTLFVDICFSFMDKTRQGYPIGIIRVTHLCSYTSGLSWLGKATANLTEMSYLFISKCTSPLVWCGPLVLVHLKVQGTLAHTTLSLPLAITTNVCSKHTNPGNPNSRKHARETHTENVTPKRTHATKSLDILIAF